jgi:hypothetical protein
MADCERLVTCNFFNDELADMPASANAMKNTYCHGNKSECARYMLISHGISARDLFPIEHERAEQILSTSDQNKDRREL